MVFCEQYTKGNGLSQFVSCFFLKSLRGCTSTTTRSSKYLGDFPETGIYQNEGPLYVLIPYKKKVKDV